MKYMMKFKHPIDDQDLNNPDVIVDPQVEYYLTCKKKLEIALPILDKVWRKTLCLQDYSLSKGHCEGIAVACQYFDEKLINRVLFNNCGMDGDEFAEILRGLNKLKDVKSITYKRNALNQEAINELDPILKKRLPRNLEELKIIDVKSSAALNNDLINKLYAGCQIRKLALVNCELSEKTFETLIMFI